MELNESGLENVLGGNTQGMGEQLAMENPDLYRQKQIEELSKAKIDEEERRLLQRLAEIRKMKNELSLDELEEIKAGTPRI